MSDRPFIFDVSMPDGVPTRYDNHIRRTLSDMQGQYLDSQSYTALLTENDVLLYEVYEIRRPELAGELLHGISIIHPGKVGDEYYMTKGHFHRELETAEVYYCLHGAGMMVMETPEGGCSVEVLSPGTVLYVPPRWAHRSINTSADQDLVMLYVYPGHAGHDYGTIQKQGFRKLVVERDNRPCIVDNPRWRSLD